MGTSLAKSDGRGVLFDGPPGTAVGAPRGSGLCAASHLGCARASERCVVAPIFPTCTLSRMLTGWAREGFPHGRHRDIPFPCLARGDNFAARWSKRGHSTLARIGAREAAKPRFASQARENRE